MLIEVYEQGTKFYNCDDFYKPVEKPEEWKVCPVCKVKPLVWEFDNGRYAKCGCENAVRAESTLSFITRNENKFALDNEKFDYMSEFKDALRDNWNAYCEENVDKFKEKKQKIKLKYDFEIW